MTAQQSQFIEINGAQLTVRDRGAGEAVLFVHGAMGDECEAVVAEPVLVDNYRVIDYHRRGWQQSESPDAPISIEQQAADAVAVLDHFDIDHAHLVGLSYGGIILLQAAVDYPDIVHSLALLEPGLPSVLNASAKFGAAVTEAGTLYGNGDKAGAMEVFGKEVAGDEFHAVFDKTLSSGYFERWVEDADTFFQFDAAAMQSWNFGEQEAARIRQPVLNMTGSDTTSYFRQTYETVQAWLPQAQNVVLSNASHAMFQSNPRGAAEQLAQFFSKHPISG